MQPKDLDNRSICMYAYRVIGGRWEEAEPYIKEPHWAYWYAHFIIKDRFEKFEGIIKESPFHCYYYAKCVLKARWIEAEPIIKQDKTFYKRYYREVMC